MNASVHFCSFDRHFQILILYWSAGREQCVPFSFWLFTFTFHSLSPFAFIYEFFALWFHFIPLLFIISLSLFNLLWSVGAEAAGLHIHLANEGHPLLEYNLPTLSSQSSSQSFTQEKNKTIINVKNSNKLLPGMLSSSIPKIGVIGLVRPWKHYFADSI